MVYDPTTRDYIDRRMAAGRTKKEAFRCLIGRVWGSRCLAEVPCLSVDTGR